MEQKNIKEILRLHKLWLSNDEAGKCANLQNEDLRGLNLANANLSGANLSGSNLRDADLRTSILIGTNLSSAILCDTLLHNANLRNADLTNADLRGINLDNTELKGTVLENKVVLTFQFNKHLAHFFGSKDIQIGCHRHSIEHWKENYKEIVAPENYTEDEIDKYLKFVNCCDYIIKEMK